MTKRTIFSDKAGFELKECALDHLTNPAWTKAMKYESPGCVVITLFGPKCQTSDRMSLLVDTIHLNHLIVVVVTQNFEMWRFCLLFVFQKCGQFTRSNLSQKL